MTKTAHASGRRRKDATLPATPPQHRRRHGVCMYTVMLLFLTVAVSKAAESEVGAADDCGFGFAVGFCENGVVS